MVTEFSFTTTTTKKGRLKAVGFLGLQIQESNYKEHHLHANDAL